MLVFRTLPLLHFTLSMPNVVYALAEGMFVGQTMTRQDNEVTDAGTTVPLSPHLQCRYSDKQYSLYSTKNSDRSPVPVRLALQSNSTG